MMMMMMMMMMNMMMMMLLLDDEDDNYDINCDKIIIETILNKLIDNNEANIYIQYFSSFLLQKPLAVRLAVMMSAAYAINFIYKRIPHTLEQRHTRRRQCLCQFIQEFLAAYLPSLRQEADLNNLKTVFTRYLNCQLKTDPVVLHTLGICHGGGVGGLGGL